jgi:hypothetical protein
VLDLLTAGVRGFEFDHLVEGPADFEPWIESRRPSPFVDTSGGLEGYLGRASRSGKDNMGQARRRAAKAERTHGAVRFVADAVDPEALDQVIELKRAQYAATGARDYFAEPNRSALLTRLLHTRDSSFGGVLSTLRAGPHLVAAHFGMRSGSVLHWWFPVYDPVFAHLSPGWMLLPGVRLGRRSGGPATPRSRPPSRPRSDRACGGSSEISVLRGNRSR